MLVKQQVQMYCGSGTVDRIVSAQTLHVQSPNGNTFSA